MMSILRKLRILWVFFWKGFYKEPLSLLYGEISFPKEQGKNTQAFLRAFLVDAKRGCSPFNLSSQRNPFFFGATLSPGRFIILANVEEAFLGYTGERMELQPELFLQYRGRYKEAVRPSSFGWRTQTLPLGTSLKEFGMLLFAL